MLRGCTQNQIDLPLEFPQFHSIPAATKEKVPLLEMPKEVQRAIFDAVCDAQPVVDPDRALSSNTSTATTGYHKEIDHPETPITEQTGLCSDRGR